MYYIVVIINSKAVQMFFLCLNNFPPKVTVFKKFKCRNKKKKFSPPGDILNFYISHHDQSHFSTTLCLSLLVSKRPFARPISYIRVGHPPSRGFHRYLTTVILFGTKASHVFIWTLSSLFISLSVGIKKSCTVQRSPIFHVRQADLRESLIIRPSREIESKLNFNIWV